MTSSTTYTVTVTEALGCTATGGLVSVTVGVPLTVTTQHLLLLFVQVVQQAFLQLQQVVVLLIPMTGVMEVVQLELQSSCNLPVHFRNIHCNC